MRVLESVAVAWLGITGNWMRTLLTMLGVIIGVSAVIILVSVGEGSRHQITQQFEALGSNMIMVTPLRSRLDLKDAADLATASDSVRQVVPSVSQRAKIKFLTTVYETTIEGVGPAYTDVRNFPAAGGRFIDAADLAGRRRVAVVGQTVVDELFKADDPLGQHIRMGGQLFTVVGVMAKKGSTLGQDNDDRVFIPVTTAQRMWRSTRLGMVYVQAASSEAAPLAVAQVQAFLEQRNLNARVQSQDQILSTVGDASRTLTLMLGAIAGVSLLVGGIGIMNIMMVSVSERTREIGIRKAIGGKRRDILMQFLAEAILLSCTGGLIGIAAGLGGATLVKMLAGLQTLVSWQSVALSFAFSAAVGIFFGLYPAMRAANLDPIVALRRE